MKNYIQKNFSNLKTNTKYVKLKCFRYIFFTLLTTSLLPLQEIRSEEIFLKCIGKFEINRGPLIKPDWETVYLTVNLNGLKSRIEKRGIQTKGRTLIRRNSYTITHRDNRNSVINIYKIHATNGTYVVESPKRNRTLIGNCQKGRG